MWLWGPTKNLGPIGSAALTFIEYKQTNRHPDNKSIYIKMKNLSLLFFILSGTRFNKYWEVVELQFSPLLPFLDFKQLLTFIAELVYKVTD